MGHFMNLGMVLSLLLCNGPKIHSQSFELMPGTQRIFLDAQYLKFFDVPRKVSLFSRARATAEYSSNQTDLFTGAYLNYTTKSGIGGTILGRISSSNSGIDLGVHYFRAKEKFMIYALPSINIGKELLYSWFSILRFTPKINQNWKVYTSLELFSAFGGVGYLSSVQRLRAGLDRKGYQFGLALNLAQSHRSMESSDINPGIFFRKQF